MRLQYVLRHLQRALWSKHLERFGSIAEALGRAEDQIGIADGVIA